MAAKPEWGKKRTCPKCSTRFYDLGQADPVVCISCGHEWVPEPILKTKQPMIPVADENKPDEADDEAGLDTDEDDLDLDVDEGGDDDSVLADVSLDDDDNEDVAAVIDPSVDSDEDK